MNIGKASSFKQYQMHTKCLCDYGSTSPSHFVTMLAQLELGNPFDKQKLL